MTRAKEPQFLGYVNGRPVRVGADGKVQIGDTVVQAEVTNIELTPVNQRRGPLARLLTLVKLAILTALIVLAFKYVITPFFETGGGNVDTREVPGSATSFDPVAALPGVTDYAGSGAQLLSISAYYVRSDGTLDLTADSYHPYVEYNFAREVAAPADAPPVGAGGSFSGKWYEPVEIKASKPGQWYHVDAGSSEYDYMNKGMERETSRPTSSQQNIVPAPKCAFADLWKTALKVKEVPQSAVATIEYDYDGYDFRIGDLSIWMKFDLDCKLTSNF
jgi:hypothetical protein